MARKMQLILAGFWLAIALFFVLAEPQWQSPGALVAGVFAIWNFVRWYSTRSRFSGTQSPHKPRSDVAPYEYIPELDFQKMEREQGERGA